MRGAGGQLAPDPKQVRALNLRNILKLNKVPSKSERVQGPIKIGASTRPHQNRGEYKALAATLKDIKGLVYRYCQRFGVLSTGF